MTDQAAQIRDEALSIFRDALQWWLPAARWEGIGAVLDELGADPDLADPDVLRALSDATIEMELSIPVRVTRIGDTPTEPAPPAMHERINHLIHRLTTLAEDLPDEAETSR